MRTNSNRKTGTSFERDLCQELWKDIPGYDSEYQVSSTGRVRSLKYGKVHYLKARKSAKGYLQVNLSKAGRMKTFRVHRLVAEGFIFPRQGSEINHKNEIKTDNRVENLEWCTRIYNVRYGDRIARQIEKVSKPVIQLSLSGTILAQYPSESQAGRELGLNSSNIAACCLGKRKTAGGFRWRWACEQ